MKKLLFILVFIGFSNFLLSQGKTVTGIVSDSEGTVIGATVKEKGKTTGVVTDINGKYSIKVSKDDAILVISYVGKEPIEKNVKGLTKLDVTLGDSKVLDEFIVTAVGVKREEKALGYAVTKVGGDDLRNTGQTSVLNSLNGQVAGANITQSSGTAGGGTRIVLRGETTLTGNNQALIVVDGIRINNSSQGSTGGTDGVANSNRAIDINQEDIETITVLKGGAASALYGIEGANGVVLITTKKGKNMKGSKKPFDVNIHSSLGFSSVNKLPELQNKYSQGTAWFNYDTNGVGIPTYYGPDDVYFGTSTGWATSWGPAMSDLAYDGSSDYWYDKNGRIVSKSDASAKGGVNTYDNLGNFFQTGITNNNNISISGGTEVATYRFSVGNMNQTGIVPNNTFKKINLGLATSLTLLDDKLVLQNTSSYINSKGHRIQQGSNLSGVMLGLLRSPVSFDNANGSDDPVNDPDAYTNPDGTQRNFRGGGGYDNPWWTTNNNPYEDQVNRILGSFNASYKFSKLFNLGTKIGYDVYTDQREQLFAVGSRAHSTGYSLNESYNVSQFDMYLTASGSTTFKEGVYGLNYVAGVNSFAYNSNNVFTEGEKFAFPGFEHISNAATQTGGRVLNRHKTFSYFGSVDLSYKNYLYLTLTGRQDYDSRLINPAAEYKSSEIGFFYPSASVSFVFTELMKNTDKLSFGKLRMSYASTAKGPSSYYSTGNTFTSSTAIRDGWTEGVTFPLYGKTSYLQSNLAGNSALRPEKSKDFEVGTDLKFFNRRLELDVAYYNRKTVDAIVPVSISGTSGFTNAVLNTGKLTTNGVDITVGGTPIVNSNFKWKSSAVFTKYKTMVDELAPGLEQLFVAGFTGTSISHIAGQQFGLIYGGSYLRDDNNNLVIDDDPTSATYGYPLADPELKAIGNPNPKFILGLTNSFSYKQWSLSFMFDMKVGNQMWNGTQGALTYFGMSKLTEDRDQPGETSTTFEGNYGHLDANGNVAHYDENGNEVAGAGSTNSTEVGLNEDWYTDNGGGFGSVAEPFIQNASTYRLRNLTISYQLPKNSFAKVKFLDGASIYFTGNNLLLFTPYQGIDPETNLTGASSNGQGLDYFNMPNTRTLTFGIRLSL